MPAFPDLTQFYMLIYGGYGYDASALCEGYLGLATGIPKTGNPPYTLGNFLAMYPKFFGPVSQMPAILASGNENVSVVPPAGVTLAPAQLVACQGITFGTVIMGVSNSPVEFIGDTMAGSNVIANASSTASLIVGQPIAGAGIPAGTLIESLSPLTMTNNATATATGIELTATATIIALSAAPTLSGNYSLGVYASPLVPVAIIQAYLNLAYASLMSSRWRESWTIGMALYIAHFLTLYLQTDGDQQTTAGQAVAAGLQQGITVSRGADGLSESLQPLASLDNWAAWTLTSYGVQLATMGRVIGAGAIYIR